MAQCYIDPASKMQFNSGRRNEALILEYDPRARNRFANFVSLHEERELFATFYALPVHYECSIEDLHFLFHTLILWWQEHEQSPFDMHHDTDVRQFRPFTSELYTAFVSTIRSSQGVCLSDLCQWLTNGSLKKYMRKKICLTPKETHGFAKLLTLMDEQKLTHFLMRICKQHLQDMDESDRLSLLFYHALHFYFRKSAVIARKIEHHPAHWRFAKDLTAQIYEFYHGRTLSVADIVSYIRCGRMLSQYPHVPSVYGRFFRKNSPSCLPLEPAGAGGTYIKFLDGARDKSLNGDVSCASLS